LSAPAQSRPYDDPRSHRTLHIMANASQISSATKRAPLESAMSNRFAKKVEVMIELYCPSAFVFADPVLLFDKYVD
jgi:hypothetical protein